MEAMEQLLPALGVPQKYIHTERFDMA
jgi:ferredoxin-NADP reductase